MALPAWLQRLTLSSYVRRIGRGLDRAYERADDLEAPIEGLRVVVLSDHHRGTGDGADDFARCEEAYRAALGWYSRQGFELWLLGDVEELWENRPREVMERYAAVLELEQRAFRRTRRFYGNHDMTWRSSRDVRRFFGSEAPEGGVREGLKLRLMDGERQRGLLFFVHGHQGTLDSGNLLVLPLSRFVVRFVWAALQRWRRFANTTPATNVHLRGKHDAAMLAWVQERVRASAPAERPVLVAGHTHRPVFPSKPPPDLAAEEEERRKELEAREGEVPRDERRVARAAAEYERARTRVERFDGYRPPDIDPPCYFNTGCCSFGDGDVTALEIADGLLRLVRWPDDAGDAQPKELAWLPLTEILDRVTGWEPPARAGERKDRGPRQAAVR